VVGIGCYGFLVALALDTTKNHVINKWAKRAVEFRWVRGCTSSSIDKSGGDDVKRDDSIKGGGNKGGEAIDLSAHNADRNAQRREAITKQVRVKRSIWLSLRNGLVCRPRSSTT
jgi:hypothetical protein